MALVPALDLREERYDASGVPQAPANIEAEQALLGCLLYDNAAFERIPDSLRWDHFYEPFHGRLFADIAGHIRRGQLAEPITLTQHFAADPAFEELGGVRYLADLVDRAPPAANIGDYARIIHDMSVRRALLEISGEIANGAVNDFAESTGLDLVEAAEQQLYRLAETGQGQGGFETFAEALAKAVDMAGEAFQRDGGLSGVSTGLIDVDRKLGGLHKSDLLILAARPSMGKTALACNVAFDIARHYAYEAQPDGSRKTVAGGVVAFFSLEMSSEQLGLRLLAEVSGVPGDRIRRGEIEAHEFARVRDAALEIRDAPLFIDATGGITLGKLAARARRLKRQHGLDAIFVDYLQLVTTGLARSENRVQDVSFVTAGLKALAKELQVPVIALSQLSRKVEERDDKKPQLSDLRESGSIEQDADVVMFLYREEYYLSRTEPADGTPEHLAWQEQYDAVEGLADLIIGKQRHGPIGTVRLAFNSDLTKFGNLAPDGRFGGRGRD